MGGNVLYDHVSVCMIVDSPHLISQFILSPGPAFVIGIEFAVSHNVDTLSKHNRLIVDSSPIFDMFSIP